MMICLVENVIREIMRGEEVPAGEMPEEIIGEIGLRLVPEAEMIKTHPTIMTDFHLIDQD